MKKKPHPNKKKPRTPVKPRQWRDSDGGVDEALAALQRAEQALKAFENESTEQNERDSVIWIIKAQQKLWNVVTKDQGEMFEKAKDLAERVNEELFKKKQDRKNLSQAKTRSLELAERWHKTSTEQEEMKACPQVAAYLKDVLEQAEEPDISGTTEAIRVRCERALQRGGYREAKCIVYGSRRSGLATTGSDVDVCALISARKLDAAETALDLASQDRALEEEKDSALEEEIDSESHIEKLCIEVDRERTKLTHRIKAALQKDFAEVFGIAKARVPVIKAVDPTSKLCVDVVVNNRAAVQNSNMIKAIVKDPVFRAVVLLVKFWAKSRGVSEASEGTLSSYAHAVLAIQTLLREDLLQLTPQQDDVPYTITPLKGGYVPWVLASHFQYLSNFDSLGTTISLNEVTFPKVKWLQARGRRRDPLGWRFSIEDPVESVDSGRPRDLGDVLTPTGDERLRAEFDRAAKLMSHAVTHDDPSAVASLFATEATTKRLVFDNNEKEDDPSAPPGLGGPTAPPGLPPGLPPPPTGRGRGPSSRGGGRRGKQHNSRGRGQSGSRGGGRGHPRGRGAPSQKSQRVYVPV